VELGLELAAGERHTVLIDAVGHDAAPYRRAASPLRKGRPMASARRWS
jgi:hypothetical protein